MARAALANTGTGDRFTLLGSRCSVPTVFSASVAPACYS
jgi:hypothetical protein